MDRGLPEQAVGWFPSGLEFSVEDEPSELSSVQHIIGLKLLGWLQKLSAVQCHSA